MSWGQRKWVILSCVTLHAHTHTYTHTHTHTHTQRLYDSLLCGERELVWFFFIRAVATYIKSRRGNSLSDPRDDSKEKKLHDSVSPWRQAIQPKPTYSLSPPTFEVRNTMKECTTRIQTEICKTHSRIRFKFALALLLNICLYVFLLVYIMNSITLFAVSIFSHRYVIL